MRRTRVFRNVANVGLSAVLVASGATAGMLAAPTAGSDNVGPGFVQQAQAKTSTAKAKKKARKAKAAYKKFMATDGWRWGSVTFPPRKQSDYLFALADINRDKVPELIVYGNNIPAATNRVRIYIYRKGRVVKAGSLYRAWPTRLYVKGHLLYHRYGSGGGFGFGHYKLSKGKLVRVAFAGGSYFEPDLDYSVKHVEYRNGELYYYQHLKINGKSVSWSEYKAGLKKLRKNSTKYTKIKYHTNTPKNRAKYL